MDQAKLSKLTLAVVGCGNMGRAIVQGVCKSGQIPAGQVKVSDSDTAKRDVLSKVFGVSIAADLATAVNADVVIFALKPSVLRTVVAELRDIVAGAANAPLLVSIAAGVTIDELRTLTGSGPRWVRAMPNTPALVGKGMTALFGENRDEVLLAEQLFSQVGRTVVLDSEALLDCATGLAGSGPAFIFTVIEALADGGVKMGLSREVALAMAASTVEGSAALVTESAEHPAILRDRVTSPGGTTASGLHELEKAGVRAAFISAVESSTEKARSGLKKS